VGGREVRLTPKEFDLLGYLMERPDTAVSRDDLLADVWGFLSPGVTRTIEVHVAHVRRKLGRPELIRTVRGVGYEAVSSP
jgi:DNA-binding response OmpR family regulator